MITKTKIWQYGNFIPMRNHSTTDGSAFLVVVQRSLAYKKEINYGVKYIEDRVSEMDSNYKLTCKIRTQPL
jgi:hypothetical protein